MWTIFENVLFLYFMFRFCTLHFETSEPEPQPQSYFKRMNGLLKMEMIASHLNFSIFFWTNTWKSEPKCDYIHSHTWKYSRSSSCFTSQFSSQKHFWFSLTHNTNLINCIRRKRKFSPLPFCNVKWITLTVIEFPINIKQFYILFQSLRALSCSKWTNEYMCGNRFSIYEPEFFGDITTSTFGTIGEIHLNTDDLIRFFFSKWIASRTGLSVFSYSFYFVAVLQIETFCDVKQQNTHMQTAAIYEWKRVMLKSETKSVLHT